LRGPFSNWHPVDVAIDVAAHFPRALTRRNRGDIYPKLVMESLLFFLECPLGLVKLVETGMLPLRGVHALRGSPISEWIWRGWVTSHGAFPCMGRVDNVVVRLEDETLVCRVVGYCHPLGAAPHCPASRSFHWMPPLGPGRFPSMWWWCSPCRKAAKYAPQGTKAS
jgi:hypothetical protein